MRKYKVACYETVHTYIYVDAESEEEALTKAEQILEEDGMPSDAKHFDKDYEACMAEWA